MCGASPCRAPPLLCHVGWAVLVWAQACLAALDFIVTSSARYNVEDGTLTLELQQLGLPRSNSNSVARAYRDGRERLREALARAVVRVCERQQPRLGSCDVAGPSSASALPSPPPPPCVIAMQLPGVSSVSWRVDRIVGSSLQHDMETACVHLDIGTTHGLTGRAPSGSDAHVAGSGSVPGPTLSFDMGRDQFRVLHAELLRAREAMARVAVQ